MFGSMATVEQILPGPSTRPTPVPAPPRARVVPYPAIEDHGLLSDRRTAALVAADGTLDWLCLPDADSAIVFGALLDLVKGGYWRLGPSRMLQGEQRYQEDSLVLETHWELEEGALVLSDTLLWPETERAPEQQQSRVVVRRLRCTRGKVRCEFDLQPAYNCESPSRAFTSYASGWSLTVAELSLRVWSNHTLAPLGSRLQQELELGEGEELWAVMELGAAGHGWSVESARGALEQSAQYWRHWLSQFPQTDVGLSEVRRTALTVHALTYAPEGSVMAAPTTSLPERIGGNWNADYRLCWTRDASLSVGLLSRLGNQRETEQYLQWLTRRRSRFGRPLQVLYGLRGEKRPRQHSLDAASGYRDSAPVRLGNHAYKQHQLGSLAFLADATWVYLQHGGPWRDEYWDLIRRAAQYALGHWAEPENGIWELAEARQYVHSKVLSWVTLDRAVKIARKTNPSFDTAPWQAQGAKIHQEVMDQGWSERLGAFRQHYEADTLDAAALLISVLEFLPGDHPRMLATLERIAEQLTIDGWVYRFDPRQAGLADERPLGQFEGAFLPCNFWLATAYAKAGYPEKAKAVLERVEKIAGPLALFAEGVDPRTGGFMGNTPLLFSHVAYVQAKLEVAAAQGRNGVPRQ